MDLLFSLLVFVGVTLGGGFVVAASLGRQDPLEKLTIGLAAHLVALFLLGFGTYVIDLPRALWWCWPLGILIALLARKQKVAILLSEKTVRDALVRWMIFATWALALLLCVQVYGGGYWAGDWLEHYERAQFWRLGGHPETRFLYDIYPLTARPPLANIIAGVLLELSGGGFARHMLLNTLLGSLFLFPFLLITRRWAPLQESRASAFALVLLMLSPMVAQNLTFGWTRHFTSFWILLGIYLLLKGLKQESKVGDRVAGFLALSAGFLAHYSAAPAIIVAVCAYFYRVLNSDARSWKRETACHVLLCGGLIGLWFGWATLSAGIRGTFLGNTTAAALIDQNPAEAIRTFALNLRDTLVPHPIRHVEPDPVPPQPSAAGRLRDFFFNIYQSNLPLMLGFGGLAVLLSWAMCPLRWPRSGWLPALSLYVIIGVAVHTARDPMGLGHICLQPIVLVLLARAAAALAVSIPPSHRRIWACGAAIDLVLGIVLHFALQTLRFGRVSDYGESIRNARALAQNGLVMPREHIGIGDGWLAGIAACALLLALLALRHLRGTAQAEGNAK